MNERTTPPAHPDPWIDLLRGYVTSAVQRLTTSGLVVERSWLDPRDPRDATIIFTGPAPGLPAGLLALVWDEETGWRRGVFESGQQGIRTILSPATYLGGGVLPGHPELVNRVLSGASEPRRACRCATDLHDGLDDALRGSN